MTNVVPVFVYKRSDIPAHKHFALVGDVIDDAGNYEFRKIIIASLDLYLKRPERQTIESDARPSYTEINDELMSQVLARCGKGDRYIILAHNDGKIYDEMDLLLLDGLAEDFRFSRDEVVIYIYIDGTVSESLHALHFSGLV